MERPNAKGSENFIVGLFVAVAIIVSAGFVVFMGGSLNVRGEFRFRTSFPDVRGLTVGAPVFLSGVRVGRVTELEFSPPSQADKSKNLMVVLTVERKYQELIKKDSKVTISTQGVLGDKVIMLMPGSLEAVAVAEGDFIVGELPGEFSEYMAKGGNLLQELDKMAHTLNAILGKIEADDKAGKILGNIEKITANLSDAQIKEAVTRLNSILKKIDEGNGTLGALVNDSSLHEDMRALVGGAQRSTAVRFLIRQAISNSEKKEPEQKK